MSEIELPERLNAAAVFVDAHLEQGRGDKPAILCRQREVTYRDLQANVNRLGNMLRSLDVRMEERVAILLFDTPEWAYAFFGAMKIGAVAVPMNTMLKPKDYEYLLDDCRARVLVVDASLAGQILSIRDSLKYLAHIVVVGAREEGTGKREKGTGDKEETSSLAGSPSSLSPAPCSLSPLPGRCLCLPDLMDEASPSLEPAETSKDDMAFWLYSSGTTGFPKGAIHLHHDMIVEADLYARNVLGLRESDVSFSVAKLFFAYGLGNGLYFSLRLGATTVLLPGRPTPEAVFDVIDRHRPTVFYSVPTSYAALLHTAEKTNRTSLDRVRMCVSAGEPLPKHLFDKWRGRFGVDILDGIGSTEILHIFISNRPGSARPGSTGQIVPGYEAKIVDDEGNQLPPRHVGTLLIKGDSIAAGYWNKHEQTKETFHGEWINTHDKFLMDEDGYFWYAGRTDDMMKVSGQTVWPTDVEATLGGHAAVLESGVTGIADQDGLIKPVAYVVLKDGHEPSPELARELQDFVKTNSAPHKYPRAVVFVDSLPKTATGKIQRYKLREIAASETPLHKQG